MKRTLSAQALFALTAGALCVSSAWSQELVNAAAPADENSKLDTVVVTSQRREQVLTKVPMSVAAMSSAGLEKASVRDITDIGRVTPGLNLTAPDPSGEQTISIRGISSTVGASTTGIYIDDVPVQILNVSGCPILCGGSTSPKIFDLDRVEVLRGPQGTLYGSSSEGGAVRFITAAPKLRGELTGMAHAEVSTWKGGAPGAEAGVVLDAPLVSDVAGFRLSLWDQHLGGYTNAYSPTTGELVQRDINSSNSQVARLAVKIVPTDRLSITPSYYYQNVKAADRATYNPMLGVDRTQANIRQPLHDRFGVGAVAVDYDFDSFGAKLIVSNLNRVAHRTDDYSTLGEGRQYLDHPTTVPPEFPLNLLVVPLPKQAGMATANSLTRNAQNTWTEEIRLTSTDSKNSRFSWIAGAYFQVARQTYDQYIYENVTQLSSMYDVLWTGGSGALFDPNDPLGNDTSYIQHDRYKNTQQALYGEASYKILPNLTGSVGLRLTRTTAEYHSTMDGWWTGGLNTFMGNGKESPVTPKFGLSWQVTADSLYYATAAKGFRQGGVNPALATFPTCKSDLDALGGAQVEPLLFKSDSVWSYEFGSKQTLAGGAMQVSGSLFWIDWNKVQTNVQLPSCGFGYVDNVGTATSKGVDLAVDAKVSKHLTLSATLGYTHAVYTKSYINPGYAAGLSSTQYITKQGDPLPTPRWTSTLGAEYGWHWDGLGQAYARADYQFSSGYYAMGSEGTQGYNINSRNMGALHLLNLRSSVKSGAWDYSIYMKNALNNRNRMARIDSFTKSAINSQGSSYSFDTALEPRMIGASVNYRF